jgi:hypothetical protein
MKYRLPTINMSLSTIYREIPPVVPLADIITVMFMEKPMGRVGLVMT